MKVKPSQLGWLLCAMPLVAQLRARKLTLTQNSSLWMLLILFALQMMSSIIGNIDLNILKFNLLSKKRKRSLEKKMLSILKNFQMLTESTIERTGLNQILAAKTWFAVLHAVQKLSLSEECQELLTNTPYHTFNLIPSFNLDVDHNNFTWTVIAPDSLSSISTVCSLSTIWSQKTEKKEKLSLERNNMSESIFKPKERRSGVLFGQLIIQNYALLWRRIDFSF